MHRQMVHVALMRHARTEWNEAGRIQGWCDSPLSVFGRRQARGWAEDLAGSIFDRLICSDLGRARATADILASRLGIAVEEDARFRERHFGTLEGKPITECTQCAPEDRPGGGETLFELRARACQALHALYDQSGGWVLVVAHHGVLQGVVEQLAGPAHPLLDGRLLKSNRLHWLGVTSDFLGIITLNAKMVSCRASL